MFKQPKGLVVCVMQAASPLSCLDSFLVGESNVFSYKEFTVCCVPVFWAAMQLPCT